MRPAAIDDVCGLYTLVNPKKSMVFPPILCKSLLKLWKYYSKRWFLKKTVNIYVYIYMYENYIDIILIK